MNPLYIVLFVLSFLILALFLLNKKKPFDSSKKNEEPKKMEQNRQKSKEKDGIVLEKKKKTREIPSKALEELENDYFKIKGHTKGINSFDYSNDGKYVVTSGSNSTIKIWEAKSLLPEVEPSLRNLNFQINILGDEATCVAFTVDSRHVIAFMKKSQDIVAYKILSKKNEAGKRYQEVHRFGTEGKHERNVNSLSVSSNSKVILTVSEETTFNVWSMKGRHIASINTNQVKNNMGTISPDSRFVLVAAWTGEVRLWEIFYQKSSGEAEKLDKVMDLVGHNSGINSVYVSEDSNVVGTASKDGTWKLYDINVRYSAGQEPKCVLKIEAGGSVDQIAVNNEKKIVAVAVGNELRLHKTTDGSLIQSTPTSEKCRRMQFSPDGNLVLLMFETHVGAFKTN